MSIFRSLLSKDKRIAAGTISGVEQQNPEILAKIQALIYDDGFDIETRTLYDRIKS